MADELRMALLELLSKAELEQDTDFLRDGVRVLAEALREVEVEQHLGAAKHERTRERTGYRNGTRERPFDTRVGTIPVKVPRVRDGSSFPRRKVRCQLLEPRKRAERALLAVVQEADIQGVSTRRVDKVVQGLGLAGISASQVSRICQALDEEVERFRTRRLATEYPSLWLDATFVQVRENGRVVSQAVVSAIGVRASGEREVLGMDVGPSEDGAFWLQCLRSLVARGLTGVRLVLSDAHRGLKGAIAAALQGAGWQRCRVHCLRNARALVPQSAQAMVAATIRTVFAQPDAASAREQWRRVTDTLRPRFPRLADLLEAAESAGLAYRAFPREHWRQIWSNNPLERLNKEVKRRTDVVGICPNAAAVIRLVGMVLAEQHDDWPEGRRYFSADSFAKLTEPLPATDTLAERADPPPALLPAS